MSVYVGPMRKTPQTRFKAMCHCFADTFAELLEFADTMGWPKTWLHNRNHERSVPFVQHFDLTASQRLRACMAGALSISTLRGEGEIIRRIRPNYRNELQAISASAGAASSAPVEPSAVTGGSVEVGSGTSRSVGEAGQLESNP